MPQPPRDPFVASLRRRFDRLIGSPLDDATWQFLEGLLEANGDTSDVRLSDEPEREIERVAARWRPLLAASVRGRPPAGGAGRAGRSGPRLLPPPRDERQSVSRLPILDRQEALSYTLAARAGQDAEVRAFRHEVLGDSLLATDAADVAFVPFVASEGQRESAGKWIRKRWANESYAEILQPAAERFPPALLASSAYIFGDPLAIPLVLVASEPKLNRLGGLAHWLAEEYRWELDAAIAFVLTGVVPAVEVLSVRFEPHEHVPALGRVLIEADPHLSPNDVASAYREARREAAGRRQREMSQKHLTLAIFVAGRAERESLKNQMAAWNEQFPEWAYTQETDFGHDRWAARRWVLGHKRKGT